MKRLARRLLQALLPALLAAWLELPGQATAQTQPPAATPPPAKSAADEGDLALQQVEAKIAQLEAATDLEEALKAQLLKAYRQAAADLKVAEALSAEAQAFDAEARNAPYDLLRAKADLGSLPEEPSVEVSPFESLPELDQRLVREEAELKELKKAQEDLEAERSKRAAELPELPKQVTAAEESLAKLDEQLAQPAPADDPPELARARRTALQAQRRAVQARIVKLQKQLAAYKAAGNLLTTQQELAVKRVVLAEQELKLLRAKVNERRRSDARAQLERAEAARDEEQRPVLHQLADEICQLATRRVTVAEEITQTVRDLEATTEDLEDLQSRFQRTKDKVDVAGLTNAIGLLLRSERGNLPQPRKYRGRSRARQEDIQDAQFAQFDLEEQQNELANEFNAIVERSWQKAKQQLGADAGDVEQLKQDIRDLLETRQQYLKQLIDDNNLWFEKLVELDVADQAMIDELEEYESYIDERILWVRSTSIFAPADLAQAGAAARWLVSVPHWMALGGDLLAYAKQEPQWFGLMLVLFLALLLLQGRLRRMIREQGKAASARAAMSLTPTLLALFYTLLISALWPGLLWALSWLVSAAGGGDEFSRAVAGGLSVVAGVFLPLEVLRQLCRSKGLGEAHFGWPTRALVLLRRQLRWFTLVVLPPVFVAAALRSQELQRWGDSLGRLCFVTAMILLTAFMHRVLRPQAGISREFAAMYPDGWFHRLRHLWYALGAAGPLVLAGLAISGYYYSAVQLAARLHATAVLVVAVLVIGALIQRWLLLSHRRMAIEQRRNALRAEQEAAAAGETGETTLPAPIQPQDAEVDITAVSEQSRKMLAVALVTAVLAGLWLVWVDVLPALGILRRVELWETTVETFEQAAADGTTTGATISQLRKITLADLALAALILVLTLLAARNLPGLLQITVLQRLPLDAGARYAIDHVARYALTVIGLVLVFAAVGIGWSKVQWLVAAVSVGLGFGLQEIFANFVSGLIILVERPIRVGDIVTIGDTTGIVSRIRIRATTITNWDRKELVVPNREFITGRLLNWTLSDKINRVVIEVGCAYGSDTGRAAELLLQIADEHPKVLADPQPLATFEGFGDSTLNLVLRAYLANLDNRLAVIHELHTTIHERFAEAGIEIAFPQLDLHIRTPANAVPDWAAAAGAPNGS